MASIIIVIGKGDKRNEMKKKGDCSNNASKTTTYIYIQRKKNLFHKIKKFM